MSLTPTEWFLVGAGLLVTSSLSWGLGVLLGLRIGWSSRDEDDGTDELVRVAPLEPAENVARTSTDGRWRDENGYHDLREVRGRGTDDPVDALDTVRESDEHELRRSRTGFRGRDLSDSEVEAWLRGFGL